MISNITANEGILRLGAFLIVFVSLAVWELILPRRKLRNNKSRRWFSNIGITALNTVCVRLLLPASAVGIAAWSMSRGFGLFNIVGFSGIGEILVTVLLLDLIIYGQHVAFHKIPFFWRIHRMHHTDLDLDVTSGSRFHTIEILLSIVIKAGAVIALGASPIGVFFFELILNLTSMFTHANIRIPHMVDRILRFIVVTPDMHRAHHSIHRDETESNYGFNLSIWDKMFRTYTPEPRDGHLKMQLGLKNYRDKDGSSSLRSMIVSPLKREL